ncbi:MAG: replicative DNA helicase [Lentimicrobiaceae bacterium]|jgi:replicative DNA helicase
MEENERMDALASRKTIKKPSIGRDAFQEHGKLPPQATDLEEAVLGALMLEKDAVAAVIDMLVPAVFYKESHQAIFEAITMLFHNNEPVDILTVTNALRSTGKLELAGGPFYITQLTSRIASSANIEFHVGILKQKFLQRELIKISTDTIRKSFEDSTDVFDLLDETESSLFSISENNLRKKAQLMPELVHKVLNQIDNARKNDGVSSGVPSGFIDLDKITGGWQRSDLIIVAARPGMGKTAFVLSMARNIAIESKKAVAFFSLEMTADQLVARLIASEAELSASNLRRGQLQNFEWEQLNSRISKLITAPIYIDDTPSLSLFELRAKCRRLKAQYDIDMVVIDYIQLMTAGGDRKGGGNREQEISAISRSLKSLAKELNIPVIALSQLNRSVETRSTAQGSKKPQLSDLRESGAIEQDADLVLFIYRPEYYKIMEDEDGNSTEGKAQIIIAKHRNGATDEIWLRFISRFARFQDVDGLSIDKMGLSLTPNTGFDQPGNTTVIMQSRLNSMDDDVDLGPTNF